MGGIGIVLANQLFLCLRLFVDGLLHSAQPVATTVVRDGSDVFAGYLPGL